MSEEKKPKQKPRQLDKSKLQILEQTDPQQQSTEDKPAAEPQKIKHLIGLSTLEQEDMIFNKLLLYRIMRALQPNEEQAA
jgi:hypothetical protein